MTDTPFDEMLLSEKTKAIWSEFEPDNFCVEASTLNANHGRGASNKPEIKPFAKDICPKCLGRYDMRHHVKTEMVGPKWEQEIGAWHFKHDCGAKLEVFND